MQRTVEQAGLPHLAVVEQSKAQIRQRSRRAGSCADLRGRVEVVDGDDDDVQAVVLHRLPLLHVLFLLT
jgi:hypothetical protein